MKFQRFSAAALAASMLAASALPATAAPSRVAPSSPGSVVAQGTISGNRTVRITRGGFATITSANGRRVETRHVPFGVPETLRNGRLDAASTKALVDSVDIPDYQPFVPGVVNVVFRDGSAPARDVATYARVTTAAAVKPSYSNDSRVNALFAKLGVDRVERIARSVSRSTLAAMRSRARAYDPAVLDIANAFQIHVTNESVRQAVRELRRQPSIAYAAPDWIASSMHVRSQPLPPATQMPAARRFGALDSWARFRSAKAMSLLQSAIPTNYGISTSMQSYLNASGIDDIAAYDEIEKQFGQLPGQGETITNVSIGDVCAQPPNPGIPVSSHLIGNQHYLDVPSMPLIPEYVVDTDGNLSGSAESCGVDPSLGEVLLDFSVMAPLPDSAQRSAAMGSGPSDLLGIAPGASYRLVVPQGTPSNSALAATFIAAAAQTPTPDVISASIGFGYDAQGFPSRFLEEDPLMRSIIATIVNADNIVVCISAGDGLRTYTNAALNPMGGSVPTNVVTSADQVTDLNDIAYSTAPSAVMDTGSIDVGGSTTDDILSANPLDPANARYVNQLAFPEVRWNGFGSFSSGFGSRVNISAPSDNIPAMSLNGTGYNHVVVSTNGGTSASAPEVAAAAAVMLQVARLTGHPFATATAVRSALVASANAIPNVPQADVPINVGPQLDLRRGVETLLKQDGKSVSPSVGRVAIARRRLSFPGAANCSGGPDSFQMPWAQDFVEATDPTYIRLDGLDACGRNANRNLNSPITIAPDWEGMPANVHYRLYVTGHPDRLLSTNPYQRVFPLQLFAAAGMPSSSGSPRSISLTYDAISGFHIDASTTFTLTFGPTPPTSLIVQAPHVAPVIDSSQLRPCVSHSGLCFEVSYDFSDVPTSEVNNPRLEVSEPGRPDPATAPLYFPSWTSTTLTNPTGTVEVPVSALGGGGIYGIAVNLWPNPAAGVSLGGDQKFSIPAYTRLVATTSARPTAPLLSLPSFATAGIPASHGLAFTQGTTSFIVSYDVSNVPGANGALLEFSAPGPNLYGNLNTFNNPNGSVADNNGRDTGSTAIITLSGTKGSVTLTTAQAHLIPGMLHVVRVVPMNGSNGIGEASDVSSIELGAIGPPNANLINGFAINPAGDDGVFTSVQPLAPFGLAPANTVGSMIGNFSQSTGAYLANNVTAVGDPYVLYGYVGGDTAVYQQGSISQTQAAQSGAAARPASLQSIAVGANLQMSWFSPALYPPLPNSTWSVVEAGQNSSTPVSALLAQQTSPTGSNSFGVFSMNATTQAFTPFIALNPPMWGAGTNIIRGLIDYDPAGNKAYVIMDGLSGFFGADDDVLATVSFATNTVTYADLGNAGTPMDFVIDPTTHIAAMTANVGGAFFSVAGLELVNVTTNAVTTVPTTGAGGIATGLLGLSSGALSKLAVDPTHGLFAVQNTIPMSDVTDNNPLSEIDVFQENGTFVSKTPRDYNLLTYTLGDHWFQLNPTTRKGFVVAPNYSAIIPFSY